MVKREPGKPVLNLDFLLETVVQQAMPLDWDKCVEVVECWYHPSPTTTHPPPHPSSTPPTTPPPFQILVPPGAPAPQGRRLRPPLQRVRRPQLRGGACLPLPCLAVPCLGVLVTFDPFIHPSTCRCRRHNDARQSGQRCQCANAPPPLRWNNPFFPHHNPPTRATSTPSPSSPSACAPPCSSPASRGPSSASTRTRRAPPSSPPSGPSGPAR